MTRSIPACWRQPAQLKHLFVTLAFLMKEMMVNASSVTSPLLSSSDLLKSKNPNAAAWKTGNSAATVPARLSGGLSPPSPTMTCQAPRERLREGTKIPADFLLVFCSQDHQGSFLLRSDFGCGGETSARNGDARRGLCQNQSRVKGPGAERGRGHRVDVQSKRVSQRQRGGSAGA